MMRRYFYKKHGRECGYTLVELLVAVAVGLVLLGGIYQVFQSSDTGYRYNQELSRLQENGRFLLEYMTREVRMAAYRGCLGRNASVENWLNDQTYAYNFDVSIEGFDYDAVTSNWSPALPDPATETGSVASSNPLAGSDILALRSMMGGDIALTTTMPPTSSTFFIPSGTDAFEKCDILMVADCSNQTAAVFLVTGYNETAAGNVIHNTGGNPQCTQYAAGFGNLAHSFDYGEGAELFKVKAVSYFVRNVDASGNAIEPTLYRQIGAAVPEPLVEGVETMQITYLVDGAANFVTADAIVNWNNVIAVRLGFLLRSPNEISRKAFDTQDYSVNGSVIPPVGSGVTAVQYHERDRRLRQVFVTTVGIRNRLP